jgi:hypothetical protein
MQLGSDPGTPLKLDPDLDLNPAFSLSGVKMSTRSFCLAFCILLFVGTFTSV